MKTKQMIQKVLDESSDDYECTAARKPHFDRSDKLRIPESVDEI